MAFENVQRDFKKSKDIPVGESISAFVVGFYASKAYPDNVCLECVAEDGSKYTLSTHGNLRYFKQNGNEPGFFYRITRLSDKQNKKGTMSCQFKVEVDRAKKMPVQAEPLEEINF